MILKKIINKDGEIEYIPLAGAETTIFAAYQRACDKLIYRTDIADKVSTKRELDKMIVNTLHTVEIKGHYGETLFYYFDQGAADKYWKEVNNAD